MQAGKLRVIGRSQLEILVIFIILGFALYFIPAIIAWLRGHQSKWAITALNALLGWTFLGWIGALVWSLTGVRR